MIKIFMCVYGIKYMIWYSTHFISTASGRKEGERCGSWDGINGLCAEGLMCECVYATLGPALGPNCLSLCVKRGK